MLVYSPRSLSSASHSASNDWVRPSIACEGRSRRRRKEAGFTAPASRRRARFGDQALGLLSGHALEVIAVLEQHPKRVVHGFGVERDAVECDQAVGPVDGLGHPRQLEQLGLAQALNE